MQVDCDLKPKCKNRKREKLKVDSVEIVSVEFKTRLKTVVLLYYIADGGPETNLPY